MGFLASELETTLTTHKTGNDIWGVLKDVRKGEKKMPALRLDPYPENTRHWPIGSLVIHSADAKRADMLMHVIAYAANGCAVTQYVSHKDKYWSRQKMQNDIKWLLDPADFNISVERIEV